MAVNIQNIPLFKTNSINNDFAKKIKVTPSLVDRPNPEEFVKVVPKFRNILIERNILFFRFMQVLGCCAVSRNDEGRFECKWCSYLTIYTAVVQAVVTTTASYAGYCSTINVSVILRDEKSEIDDAMIYVAYSSCVVLQFIYITSFFEANKLAKFLNDWSDFELLFFRVTGKKFKIGSSHLGNVLFVSIIIFTTASSFLGVGHKLYYIGDRYRLALRIEPLLFFQCSFCILCGLILCNFWRLSNRTVSNAATGILEDIQVGHWKLKDNLDDHFDLWLSVRGLCQTLSDAWSWSFLVMCGLLFFLSLPAFYMGIVQIMNGHYAMICGALGTVFMISVVVEFAHQCVVKVGNDFRDGLAAVLINCNSSKHKMELLKFIKNICTYPPVMTFGGFFILDRSLNISLYSSIITYIIIMIQFRGDK